MSAPIPIIGFDHWKIHTGKRFSVPILGTNIQRLAFKVVTPVGVSAHCLFNLSGVFANSVSGSLQYATAVTSGFADTVSTPQNHILGGAISVCTVTYDTDGTFSLTSPTPVRNFTVAAGVGVSVGNLNLRDESEIIVPPNSTYYFAIELSGSTGTSNPLACTLDFYEETI